MYVERERERKREREREGEREREHMIQCCPIQGGEDS